MRRYVLDLRGFRNVSKIIWMGTPPRIILEPGLRVLNLLVFGGVTMKRRAFSLLVYLLLAIGLAGCLEKIPTEFTINTEIDTGRDLKHMVDDALEDLHEAEHIAGEEARETIQDAISQLEEYSVEIIEVLGDELDQTIHTLDSAIQEKLLWIQIYTEEVHG
jgi:hypothetical protein